MRKIEEIQLERARMKQQKYREAHRVDEWNAKFNAFIKAERAKKEARQKAELENTKVETAPVVESVEPEPEVVEKPKKSKKKKSDVDAMESFLGQVPTSKVDDSLV